MRSYRHILAAIDPRDATAKSVLDAAETLQCAQNVRMTVASALPQPTPPVYPHMGMGVANAAVAPAAAGMRVEDEDTEHMLEQREREVKDLVDQTDFTAEIRVPTGDPRAAIPDLAEEIGADLIIVGAHDRDFIESMLTGSVSKRIADRADCDVLFVSGAPSAP